MERLDAAAVRAWAHASRVRAGGFARADRRGQRVPGAGLRHRHERAAHRRRWCGGARAGRSSRGGRPRRRAGVRTRRDAVGPRQLRCHRQPVPDRVRAGAARGRGRGRRRAVPRCGGTCGPRCHAGAAGGHGPHARGHGRPQRDDRRGRGADLATMLDSVVADARLALAGISAEHPVLRAAHVLDAGACALLVVLDALAGVLGGEPSDGDSLAWLPEPPTHPWPVEPAGGAFEVMLLVSSVGTDLDGPLHAAMAALGDSVAVVGGDGTWHVHVHTDDPGGRDSRRRRRPSRAGPRAPGRGRPRVVGARRRGSLRSRGVHEVARDGRPGTRPRARSRWCAAPRRPSARTTWSGP